MNYKIKKTETKQGSRYELRAWSGVGEARSEWRRRFKSKSEAQDFIDRKLLEERSTREAHRQTGGDPMKLYSFKSEYENWAATRAIDLSSGWRSNTESYWRETEQRLAELTVLEITPSLLRTLERSFRESGNSKATVQRKVAWIKGVLNYAVSMERIPYNPIAKFKSAKPDKPSLEFWEKDEAQSFLAFADKRYPRSSEDRWKYLVYLVALNTALRAGEIWALRPNALRQSFDLIYVTEQLDLLTKKFRGLKGKEARSVPLSKEIAAELMSWIDARGLKPCELMLAPLESTGVDHNNFVHRVFAKDLKDWGGRQIKFHGLRHTAATLMLDSQVDIRTVQLILGHKNIETTLRYVHAIGQNVRKAAATYVLTPSLETDSKKSVAKLWQS
ncbi:MAG: site-specific integrase [Proteobacteria bacterium]|nr:MAG: site-specific integrase [Pseudomonadota bacterium]